MRAPFRSFNHFAGGDSPCALPKSSFRVGILLGSSLVASGHLPRGTGGPHRYGDRRRDRQGGSRRGGDRAPRRPCRARRSWSPTRPASTAFAQLPAGHLHAAAGEGVLPALHARGHRAARRPHGARQHPAPARVAARRGGGGGRQAAPTVDVGSHHHRHQRRQGLHQQHRLHPARRAPACAPSSRWPRWPRGRRRRLRLRLLGGAARPPREPLRDRRRVGERPGLRHQSARRSRSSSSRR